MADVRVADIDNAAGEAFECALAEHDWSGLAALVVYWRAMAARAEGELAGLRETLDYLKWRLRLAEGREDVTVVEPRGDGTGN